jgi:hypothetical protein
MAELKFHFIKGPDYREVAVHGALCGLSPQGEGLFLVLYSERSAIPGSVTHQISDAGQLGEETLREGKEGVVRNMHVCGHMSIEQARALRQLLDEKIAEFEVMTGATRQ